MSKCVKAENLTNVIVRRVDLLFYFNLFFKRKKQIIFKHYFFGLIFFLKYLKLKQRMQISNVIVDYDLDVKKSSDLFHDFFDFPNGYMVLLVILLRNKMCCSFKFYLYIIVGLTSLFIQIFRTFF